MIQEHKLSAVFFCWVLLQIAEPAHAQLEGKIILPKFYTYHAGDDTAWAQPEFDDSAWEQMKIDSFRNLETRLINVRRTRDVFSLFVPEPVLDKIAKEGLESIKLGGAEEGIATILFTDIRSFTSIAEKLSPNETLAFLNEFMRRMQPVIHRHGGFINQFVGDEINEQINGCCLARLVASDESNRFKFQAQTKFFNLTIRDFLPKF